MAPPLTPTKTLTHNDYTVAWICALPLEKTAARNMLDELHVPPPQPEHDKNIYTFGCINGHNVVIACQGDMGTTAAAVLATRMDGTFRRLRFGLLVGIAGGVPDRKDVRLGDVVVSKGDGLSGGVVVHDRGKVIPGGFEPRPFLNGAPEVLRNAVGELDSRFMDQDNKIAKYITEATQRNPRFSDFGLPNALTDRLFQSYYPHVDQQDETCSKCDKKFLIPRPPRNGSVVHFGVIASGNQVIKDGLERLGIRAMHPGVLAVEMEAAGLMDVFGCLTIRGICDYADSHKNDGWQPYAAAAAAAVAKEVLEIVPVPMITATAVATVVGQ
jgi:nucleoside phosphorylase